MDVAPTFHALVGGLEYPRFAVCLSHNNRTYRGGRDTGQRIDPGHEA